MKKSLIIISLLISSIFAEDYAGLSGSFMRLGITARSIAMGGAFTAEKDHGFSTFYNPSEKSLPKVPVSVKAIASAPVKGPKPNDRIKINDKIR